jgi:hypothetical protein
MAAVRADAQLQQVEYTCGLDDHISQFAIQYGFVVGFAPCMPALALLAFAAAANAASVTLTSKNFAAEVVDSGKNAFVKFQAPW